MEKYDRKKLIGLMNRSRELHAAYSAISDDRSFYIKESRKLKKMLIDADRQGGLKNQSKKALVKIGKWEGQEQKPVKEEMDFVPLHEMPLNEVISNFKGHPAEPYFNSGTLREYVKFSEEYERLEAHFQDLTNRSTEATRVVSECIDFLKNNGVSDTEIPMR